MFVLFSFATSFLIIWIIFFSMSSFIFNTKLVRCLVANHKLIGPVIIFFIVVPNRL